MCTPCRAGGQPDPGLDLDRLALARFDFAVQGWPEARARRALDRLAEEAGRQDGTEAVAIVSGLPLRRFGRSASLATLDRPFAAAYHGQSVTLIAGTPSVFTAFGVPIVGGRSFDERDTAASLGVAVLSERAARRLFDTTDVVGRQVLRRRPSSDGRAAGVDRLTVIGVAGDTDSGDGGPGDGTAYVPFAQSYEPFLTLAARTSRSPTSAVAALKNLTQRLEPELGLIDAGTGTELSGVENLAFVIMGALTGPLGTMAMVLTGLYGVLTYVVAHARNRGPGAGRKHRQIMRLILMDGLRPVVEGWWSDSCWPISPRWRRPALTKPLPAIDATLLVLVPLPFLVAALLRYAVEAGCGCRSTLRFGT